MKVLLATPFKFFFFSFLKEWKQRFRYFFQLNLFGKGLEKLPDFFFNLTRDFYISDKNSMRVEKKGAGICHKPWIILKIR